MTEIEQVLNHYHDTMTDYMGAIVRALHEGGVCSVDKMAALLESGQDHHEKPNLTILAFAEGLRSSIPEYPPFSVIQGGLQDKRDGPNDEQ